MNKIEYTAEYLSKNYEFPKSDSKKLKEAWKEHDEFMEEFLERIVTVDVEGNTWSFIPHPIFDKL